MSEKSSFLWITNKECKYYPCHKTYGESFNCLFCFCPLYALDDRCGGNFTYTDNGVKDCLNCLIPHSKKGYSYIMRKIPELCLDMDYRRNNPKSKEKKEAVRAL